MTLIAAAAFAFVLEYMDHGVFMGRTTVYGFATKEECEATLKNTMLGSMREGYSFRGKCMRQEELIEEPDNIDYDA